MTTETAPHFEKITRALEGKIGTEVSEQELREKFEQFLQFGVPPEQAVRSLIRQYGEGGGATATQQGGGPDSDPVKLIDLQPGVQYVNLLVRVVHVDQREIQVRGQPRTIWSGILGDDTATRPFTSWSSFDHAKGDVLLIKGAYTKEFNGEVQVNFGDRVEIKEAEADALPEYDASAHERKIGDLQPGIGRCVVTGRVLDVEHRNVLARGEEKTITTGTLADESGQIPFTAWADLDLEKDQVVKVDAGYIKSYRGVPQFNFDDAAEITKLEGDVLPEAEELDDTEPVSLGEIVARGGGTNVTVHATLIEVRPGSGLVFRDPETNRVIPTGNVQDPETAGKPDMRIKAVFDDGTGAVNAIVMRAETEQLYGHPVAKALEVAKDAMSWDVIEEELRAKVTGRPFEVTGNALQDDFGISLLVNRIKPLSVDVQARAKELAERARDTAAVLAEAPETQGVDA